MSGLIWIWGMLWLAGGCVRIDQPPPAAPAPVRAAPAGAVQVDVTCVLPATGPAVANGVLVARLVEYVRSKPAVPQPEDGEELNEATRSLQQLIDDVRASPRDFIARPASKELEVQP